MDPQTAHLMYESGQLDICFVSMVDLERDLKDPKLKAEVKAFPLAYTLILGMQERVQPEFADRSVRRAIAMAIDKDAIVRIAAKSVCPRADTYIPSFLPAANLAIRAIPYDIRAAQDLLKSAGFPGGRGFPTLTFTTLEKVPEWTSAATIIRDNLRRNLGIEVNIRECEGATFFSELAQRKIAFYQVGDGGSFDPHDFITLPFRSGGKLNRNEYSNPEFDKLCDAADIESNDQRRVELFRQAEQIMLDDAAIIPVYRQVQQMLVKPYIVDYQTNAAGLLPHFRTRFMR